MGRKNYPSDVKCYNCGILIPDEEKTWEHVPMDSLYKGFAEEDKRTRIKVCGCRSCNQQYSFIEQRLRNLIAVIGRIKHRDDLSEIIQASDRSLKTDKEFRGQWIKLDDENYYFSFNTKDFDDIHIKNMKGLIYHEFGVPLLDDEYKISVGSDCGIEDRGEGPFNMNLDTSRSFFSRQTDWKESGNPDIFKYKLGYNYSYTEKRPDRLQDVEVIHCMMMYHNLVYAYVIAYRNDIFDKLYNASY